MRNKYNKCILILLLFIALLAIILCTGKFIKNKNFQSKTDKLQVEPFLLSSEIIDNKSLEISQESEEDSEKIAYITIDDGPSKYTKQILDILDENKVKATFFMIDRNMKKYKEEVNRAINEGHSIGFHSVTHDISKLYENPETTLNEFETCKETLYNISGTISNLARLPYGSKPYMPKESYEKLIENKYLIWDWNLDTLDWKSTTDQIISNVLYYGRNRKELVLLIHEKEQSVEALDSTIRVLKERGYEILPITENCESKNFWKENLK